MHTSGERIIQPRRTFVKLGWFCLIIVLGALPQCAMVGPAFASTPSPQSLVERASDVFLAEVDIRTGADQDPTIAQYTVLTTQVLKGMLVVPAIVVIQLPDPAIVLNPGESYLFLTRFDPVALRYVVDDPSTGIVSGDIDVSVWQDAVTETWCAYDDVLMWNGTIYARQMWNQDKRFVPREYVGKSVGTVETLNWAATACSTWIEDGTASRVPEGTAIHRMKAYDPRFRVVVRLPDGHRYLYQAVYREDCRDRRRSPGSGRQPGSPSGWSGHVISIQMMGLRLDCDVRWSDADRIQGPRCVRRPCGSEPGRS